MSQAGSFNTSGIFPPGTVLQTLTGNTGGAVSPDGSNNIDIIGISAISVAGNPGTNTLEISLSDSIADEFDANTGTAVPALGILNILGSSNVDTVGAGNTITISLGDAIADEYDADTGTAIPALGVLNILGDSQNVVTSAAGNTVTVGLAGITQHSLQVGGATNALTQLGVATNGQIPIGSTGADPVLATLTAGTNISITNGAGSITINATPDLDLTYTPVSSTPYVVLSTDQFLGVNSSGGTITIELPNAPGIGRVIIVKDSTGSANTNNITVTTVGGAVNIDGATSYIMNTQYASIQVIFNGSAYEIF